MNEKRFRFWQKWLTYANLMSVGVGFLCAFAGNSFFFEAHNNSTQDVFFNGEPISEEVLLLKNWLFGIIGGTIVGYHSLMIFVSENAFKNKEKWAYLACWFALMSWFIIDSSISFYFGAVHNIVLINIVALVTIGLPLVFTKKAFYP